MKTNILFILGFIILTVSACEQKDPLLAKKDELKTQKAKLQKIKSSISKLEKEISSLDPDFAKKNRKATLITTIHVVKKNFEH